MYIVELSQNLLFPQKLVLHVLCMIVIMFSISFK